LQDEDFDKSENLYSIPALLGKRKALLVSRFSHSFTMIFLIIAGFNYLSGTMYWIGTALFFTLLLYQHSIVRPDDLSKVNVAFATTNGFASIAFAFFLILGLLY
jgi:4-hydroxybenzoate polyprenyltransferase